MRIVGALFVLAGCGSIGFYAAGSYMRKSQVIRCFLLLLENMMEELKYRCTPLPQLCRICSTDDAYFSEILALFAESMEKQIAPNPRECMQFTLAKFQKCNGQEIVCMHELADLLGSCGLSGQLRKLEYLHSKWSRLLQELTEELPNKQKRIKTLGICTGCALAILLV